jgi:hypothetical protein
MNSVGKPYAGNLHVRFDEGLLVEKPAVYSIVKKFDCNFPFIHLLSASGVFTSDKFFFVFRIDIFTAYIKNK